MIYYWGPKRAGDLELISMWVLAWKVQGDLRRRLRLVAFF